MVAAWFVIGFHLDRRCDIHQLRSGVIDDPGSRTDRLGERNDVVQRQLEGLADRAKCAEGRPAAARDEVAQRSLVEVSLSSQVSACPAAQNPHSLYSVHVD